MLITVIILIAFAFILNELSKKYSIKGLTYKREMSRTVVEIDEEFKISTTLENNKFLPVTFLQIYEEYPNVLEYKGKVEVKKNVDKINHVMNMTLLPYQRVRRAYSVSCSKRGRYLLRDITMSVGDILGLRVFTEDVTMLQEVVALPKPFNIRERFIPYGSYNGDLSVRRWIIDDPIMIVGIREYTGLEPQKTIHWPSTLKTGKLMVKKFDFTTDNKVMVILNIEAFKPFWMKIDHVAIEKCISIARTLFEEFEELGIPYGFATNSEIVAPFKLSNIIPPGWGKAHLESIIESLGRVDYGIKMTFEDLLEKLSQNRDGYGTYIVITPIVLDSYIHYINFLSMNCQKLVLLSLNETNLPLIKDEVLTFVERRDDV